MQLAPFRALLAGALVGAALTACGGAYYDMEIEAPQVSVAIVSAQTPLIAGQASSVQAAVVNTSQYGATNVLVQVAAPIGFQYQNVICLSSGAPICPPVSVQQLAGGLFFPSFPAGTQVSFMFDGVTTGAAGSQVVLVVIANVPGDQHSEDNTAMRYVPVVAP